jgi:transcriptional regulator with XRE-family HTH domain
MSTFQHEIVSYLAETSLTVRDIMEIAGVTKMTVYRWLSGENEPHPAMQKALLSELHDKLSPIDDSGEV